MLELLSRILASAYTVATATGGADGLQVLRDRPNECAVILSDMQMPEMDGAAFLAQSRTLAPEAVRVLITGNTDIDSAVAAINDGQIFRFITKPCPPPLLLSTVAAALRQHQLVTAERVLLEQTLHGSIQALSDVLALSNPAVFGRALRLKQLVAKLATSRRVQQRWQLEVAAMLSQMACTALPGDTLGRLYLGQRLSAEETAMVARLPDLTEKILLNIPRLDTVRDLLFASGILSPRTPPVLSDETLREGAMILRIAADFDSLDLQGLDAHSAIGRLRADPTRYDATIVDALAALYDSLRREDLVSDIPWEELEAGMVIAKDLFSDTGMLLAARGYSATPSFVERVRNAPPGTTRTVSIVVSDPGPPAPPARAARP